MAIKTKILFLVLGLVFCLYEVTKVAATPGASSVFDVTKFGAKGNGKPEYTEDSEDANSLVNLNHIPFSVISFRTFFEKLFPNSLL